MNYSTLLAKIASDFSTKVLPVIRYVLFGIIIACAIVMIITTLMQSNDSSNSLDAFTGAKQESYYSQNKGQTTQSKLKKITIAMASIIAISAILFFVTLLVYTGW